MSKRALTRGLSVLLSVGALLGATATSIARAAAPSSPAEASSRVLVKYRDGTSQADAERAERAAGGTHLGDVHRLGVRVLRVGSDRQAAALESLHRDPHTLYAESDALGRVVGVPNDPNWSQQWGPARVKAPLAWDTTFGAASTVVAVLDTGIAAGHQDLAGGLTAGWDFVNGDSDPADDHGHGTSAAGVAAARTNNGLGIAGACGACTIMPVKVADSGGYALWSNLASGITWATDHGARVISMSLAGTSGGTTLSNAVQYAHDRGVVLVAAAGNAGNTALEYPAAYGPVVSVAGSDSSDNRYSWSTYGSWVDVAAPGCNQATTMSGGYSSFCGTSSATPLVAGVAALLASARPSASNTAIEAALSSTALPVAGSWVHDGRIDAGAAVSALLGTAPPPPPPPPPPPDPTPTPPPSTVSETFSASLSNKIFTRTFTFTSGAGASDLSLSFTKASALTLSVKDGANATVANLSGPSVLRVTTAPGAAGTWTVVVSGSTRASFTLTVSHPAA